MLAFSLLAILGVQATLPSQAHNTVFNVLDLGAKGDGEALDTAAITRAYSLCKDAGRSAARPEPPPADRPGWQPLWPWPRAPAHALSRAPCSGWAVRLLGTRRRHHPLPGRHRDRAKGQCPPRHPTPA